MPPRALLQIVPGFRPTVDGLGDFAWNLAQGLFAQHGIRTHFLVYRAPKSPLHPAALTPHTASYLSSAEPSALLAEVDRLLQLGEISSALLHWGPYSYTSNGLPLAFTPTVEQISQRLPLASFLHETYAFGPPWKKAFWTRRNQRQALGRVLNTSRVAFYSCDLYGRMISALNRNQVPLHRVLIFSNIGELATPAPLAARKPHLAVFGQGATRAILYREQHAALAQACTLLGIDTILDIGSSYPGDRPTQVGPARIQALGYLTDTELSAVLADSRAGIIAYWPEKWEKSGVLGAYAAHGMVPVMAARNPWHGPKPAIRPFLLVEELPALAGTEGSIPPETLQTAADKAHRFYQQYQSLAAAVRTVSAALDSLNR